MLYNRNISDAKGMLANTDFVFSSFPLPLSPCARAETSRFARAATLMCEECDQVLNQHADSQTVIISPLSLDTVTHGPKVKIFTMRPIDRNQTRLPYVAASGGAE